MTNSEAPDVAALRELRGFIFDLDGVIYRGNAALPGAAEVLAALRSASVPFLFLTNNATTPSRLVAERLKGMGIPANAGEVLTSSEVTAAVLAAEMPGCRVFAVGEAGLWEDRDCTYARLRDATLAIQRGAQFLATNTDRTLPTEEGFIPGAGALVGALQIATDVAPRVIGKPSREIFTFALRRLGTEPGRTATVGDRAETDIVGGQRAGLRTIAMLTGAGKAEEFATLDPPPGWTFRDLVVLRQAYFGK
jgi:4-nitrophenyl phosphatase